MDTSGPFSVFSVALLAVQEGVPFKALMKWNTPLLSAMAWLTLVWMCGFLLLLLTYVAEAIVLGASLVLESIRGLYRFAHNLPSRIAGADRLYVLDPTLLRMTAITLMLLGPMTGVVSSRRAHETRFAVVLAHAGDGEWASRWLCREDPANANTFECARAWAFAR